MYKTDHEFWKRYFCRDRVKLKKVVSLPSVDIATLSLISGQKG